MTTFSTPATGDLSRRIHGAEQTMRKRAASARAASRDLPYDSPAAAALRGKAGGYEEAADLLRRLDRGDRLPPKRHRWERAASTGT